MAASGRKTDHVLKSVYKHAQKDKKEVRFCKKKGGFITNRLLVD
jgi:3-hydroxyacyl-CoA dehydrogenase